jgi:Protein of unknown function (DUF1569)
MKSLAAANDLQEIQARVEALTPADRRLWGKMTVHEMVCHLADSLRCPLGEKTASEAKVFSRRFYKWVALNVPMKWPQGVATRPEMEQGVGGSCPTDFDADRRAVQELLARFAGTAHEEMSPHPIFGQMTKAEWLRWGYLHTDHHLRQFGR